MLGDNNKPQYEFEGTAGCLSEEISVYYDKSIKNSQSVTGGSYLPDRLRGTREPPTPTLPSLIVRI
jgi:hypothetical protein